MQTSGVPRREIAKLYPAVIASDKAKHLRMRSEGIAIRPFRTAQ